MWFLDKLRRFSHCSQKSVPKYLLYSTTHQLSEITSNDPQGQVLATGVGRRERHDRSAFRNIPSTRPDTSEETTEYQVPLVTELAIAVI